MPHPCPATTRAELSLVSGLTAQALVRCDDDRGHPGMHSHTSSGRGSGTFPAQEVTTWPPRLVAAAWRLSDAIARLRR